MAEISAPALVKVEVPNAPQLEKSGLSPKAPERPKDGMAQRIANEIHDSRLKREFPDTLLKRIIELRDEQKVERLVNPQKIEKGRVVDSGEMGVVEREGSGVGNINNQTEKVVIPSDVVDAKPTDEVIETPVDQVVQVEERVGKERDQHELPDYPEKKAEPGSAARVVEVLSQDISIRRDELVTGKHFNGRHVENIDNSKAFQRKIDEQQLQLGILQGFLRSNDQASAGDIAKKLAGQILQWEELLDKDVDAQVDIVMGDGVITKYNAGELIRPSTYLRNRLSNEERHGTSTAEQQELGADSHQAQMDDARASDVISPSEGEVSGVQVESNTGSIIKDNSQSFAVNRGNVDRKNVFRLAELGDIKTGIEGRKILATISSDRGEHGRYFLKQLPENEGKRQLDKWKYLKDRGVNVPNIFKPIVLADGTNNLLIQDLSENGRYQVLSGNNFEARTTEYLKASKQISSEARDKLKGDIVYACEAAAGKHEPGNNPGDTMLELDPNAFMLAMNPNDSSDAKVYVADFGLDVSQRNKQDIDSNLLLEINLQNAAVFYASMTGEVFQLPDDSPQAYLNKDFASSGKEMIDFMGYSKLEN